MFKNMRTIFRVVALSLSCCLSNKAHDLVDIEKVNPAIRLDIRYATANNITHKPVYQVAKCYLRKHVAEKLDLVQKDLEEMGYSLVVFDGYRPLSVQKIFWNLLPDERYVADPAKGSRHNRACAVDCKFVKKDGTEVEWPTEFDDFTEKAHRDYKDLSAEAIRNRELLEQVMTKHGFIGLPTEWWHFDYADWQNYDILDVDFADLEVQS